MPKLTGLSMDDLNQTLHGFQYTSVSVDKLGALEYTLAQMVADQTGSVAPFKNDLEKMLQVSSEACKNSPRANNLLYRTTAFNSSFSVPKVTELHGFTLLDQVDTSKFIGSLNPDGGTPLIDATLEAVEAIYDYGKKLYAKHYTCNGILFILTDGEENASDPSHTTAMIKDTIARVCKERILESIRTILIGVNDVEAYFKAKLEQFRNEAGLDEYVSIGEATPGKLAKLAQFVSQSVSSQSQSLGSGGPSQPLSFKF
jgi:uncharacterized protein YegL